MAEQAGPSGAGSALLGRSVEETKELFETGVECIRRNDLEMAVDIFDQVLRARIARYGELAPECASAYYRYGSALLYQAQDNADVFGTEIDTGVHQDVENKENTESGEPKGVALTGKGKQEAGTDVPGNSSGPAQEERPHLDEKDGADPDIQENVSAYAENADATDLQIAWENLDTARAIWTKNVDQHYNDLAIVHALLGDVALENEAFNDSLVDYDQALQYQKLAGYSNDDRRGAEIHFKKVMALQFLQRPEDALVEVQAAQDILHRKMESLKQTDGEKSPEYEDVKCILEEMNEKKLELESQAKEQAAMAEAVKGIMSQFKSTAASASQKGLGDELAPTTNKSNLASPVKDLGVVGRGTKRINLAPMDSTGQQNSKEGKELVGPSETKKARNLEDLMGGNDACIGFDQEHANKPSTQGHNKP